MRICVGGGGACYSENIKRFHFPKYKKSFLLRKYNKFLNPKATNKKFFNLGTKKFYFLKYKKFLSGDFCLIFLQLVLKIVLDTFILSYKGVYLKQFAHGNYLASSFYLSLTNLK